MLANRISVNLKLLFKSKHSLNHFSYSVVIKSWAGHAINSVHTRDRCFVVFIFEPNSAGYAKVNCKINWGLLTNFPFLRLWLLTIDITICKYINR